LGQIGIWYDLRYDPFRLSCLLLVLLLNGANDAVVSDKTNAHTRQRRVS